MSVKLIHEDLQVEEIKKKISKLDTKQFYFLEHFLNEERKARKAKVFNDWISTLNNIIGQNGGTNSKMH